MKRSEMLTTLSHDHHQALRMGQLLRRADAENAAETKDAFARFWELYLGHVRIEEEILFPKYGEFVGAGDAMVGEALEDHELARAFAEQILSSEQPPVEVMHELGEKLTAHVRFEERELFPAIEEAIPEDQQAELLKALDHADPGPDWQPGHQQ